jgi:hypothetical protein
MTAAPRVRRRLKLRDTGGAQTEHARSPQSQTLLEILNGAALFHAPDQIAYADIKLRGHRETWKVRSSGFRNWLSGEYYQRTGGAPNTSALEQALFRKFSRRVIPARENLMMGAAKQERAGWPMQPAWRIPGVGVLHPCIDRVVIVSTASVSSLKMLLPLPILKRGFHSFEILTYSGPHPHLRSTIVAVGAGNQRVWQLLKRHEHRLRRYWIIQVEYAFDVRNRWLEDVQALLLALIARLDKRWHQRRHLHLPSSKPGARLSEGWLSGMPTAYYEDRRSRVSMKCYGRRSKLPGGRFGACMIIGLWSRRETDHRGQPARRYDFSLSA